MPEHYERSEDVAVTGDEDAGALWSYIIEALGCRAKSEPVPQALADKAHDAACILAAATLHQAGMSLDACERLFVEREHAVKMNYDAEDDSFGITIEWDDGLVATMRRTPFDDYADEVRSYLGDGHERFSTEEIRAAKDSFAIAWPQAWRVAQRLEMKWR